MKTIFVIDKPENCHQCPLFYVESDGYYGYYACVDKEIVYQDVGDSEKPKHCPLKPMPQKKNKILLNKNTTIKDFNSYCSYRDGWNDCINEILGETE